MMKRIFIIFLVTILSTAVGLYFRPSYFLVGQMDWFNVLTKGYFVGTLPRFFTQGFLDESFFFVMRFTAGGTVAGIFLGFLIGGAKGKAKKKKA